MKLIKRISAFIAASAIAATMAVAASAATYEDCVKAAKDAGVPDKNVKELENFLTPNKDKFTSAQYDDMISVLNQVRDKFVVPYVKGGEKEVAELKDKTPDTLTEADKIVLGRVWTKEQKDEIAKTLIDLGKKYNVTIEVTDLYTKAPSVKASINGNTQTGSDKPVANTGAENTTGAAAAIAVATLAVAGTGLAITVRKNRD